MKIGLIDVDGHNFPNLPLMKLSAWHKKQGDSVEWYNPMCSGHLDKVYMSKVFSFTPDYPYPITADVIEKGGSGYCISLTEKGEVYDTSKDRLLPHEVEHTCPDYSLYGIKDCAFGFLTRGCPRNCHFCHVAAKEGTCSTKVANLSEFWNGQKEIILYDPNILACRDWKNLLQQLIDSKAMVNFSQGLDIRLLTEEKGELLAKIRTKNIHFAWDRYQDKEIIVPMFEKTAKLLPKQSLIVYVLCNYDTTIEQDLERINTLRSLGYIPYVMIYDKEHLPKGHILYRIARWCNNKYIFRSCKSFDEYKRESGKEDCCEAVSLF